MSNNNTEVVFVFGSNLAGRHGRGAAWDARVTWGAEYGVGKGRTGSAYAIPTKDSKLRVLPLSRIGSYVDAFLDYANKNPSTMFYLTTFGTGLAGYSLEDIKGLLAGKDIPYNICFTKEWLGDLDVRENLGL
jgi:hypothetical protein